MTKSRYFALPAMLAAGAIAMGSGSARAADPTTAELMQQLQQLQSKVQELEAKHNDGPTSKDVDATVERVLNDANSRSQMLQMEGFTAGWTKDKGFRIQDAAGNWQLHPFFQFQFRNVTNFSHSNAVTSGGTITGFDEKDRLQNGFDMRRMKFGFDGNAFSPDLTYYFLWASENDGGGVGLEQAWVKYFFNDSWAVRLGQIRNPVFHETDTSSGYQLAADRSLANLLLTGSNEAFTQSVSLVYAPKEGPITGEVGISDGYISGNSGFTDSPTAHGGAFARVNYFVMGDRKSYSDFTARGNKADLLVVGGGIDYTTRDDEADYRHTVDVQYENTNGLSLYVAYLGNWVDSRAADDQFWNYGFVGQVGYMVNEDWEVFGRASYSKFDQENAFGEDTWCELTAGVNWYVGHGHNAKVTLDATVLPNGSPIDNTDLGILASDKTEAFVRAQFQLLL